ncbi:MAG: NUMOD4 domain-containing protein [Salinivirgaceae bacterium]|jgi:hypothetical protein|nr:NUMOD4 domain-containing protein [Salinivirgaceae bacterium]
MERRLKKIEDEAWEQIPYADKHYEVSNYGRVKSFCYDKVEGRIVKPGIIKGFQNVSFLSEGKKKSFLVHKITAELFVKKTDEAQNTVIHLDWNKGNNHSSNLQWVTKELAYKRMFKRIHDKRRNSKEKIITYSKLNVEDVVRIKSMLSRGITQNVIAKLFCVSEMQITRIKRGENWSHVKMPEEVAQ